MYQSSGCGVCDGVYMCRSVWLIGYVEDCLCHACHLIICVLHNETQSDVGLNLRKDLLVLWQWHGIRVFHLRNTYSVSEMSGRFIQINILLNQYCSIIWGERLSLLSTSFQSNPLFYLLNPVRSEHVSTSTHSYIIFKHMGLLLQREVLYECAVWDLRCCLCTCWTVVGGLLWNKSAIRHVLLFRFFFQTLTIT